MAVGIKADSVALTNEAFLDRAYRVKIILVLGLHWQTKPIVLIAIALLNHPVNLHIFPPDTAKSLQTPIW
ncbi:hypothetical protein PN466_19505 [Roseofilum reptotaenium CS-1145]|uniref:Uncharacterized protein n=1 Tax=Roseofilum reptotaenium AO1-A TaxID=1925591 RepID=A0A1L9QK51_9CYAN|nr:hypothetical protein [Roseofilum reptotaenium]MDB9519136.1 hypothetical protein [Roseofilum reptotaenium CS-1145]OJJ15235.1 hypothetical protein BI308_24530 [Roseofilum reptotaenium AO1-A]